MKVKPAYKQTEVSGRLLPGRQVFTVGSRMSCRIDGNTMSDSSDPAGHSLAFDRASPGKSVGCRCLLQTVLRASTARRRRHR